MLSPNIALSGTTVMLSSRNGPTSAEKRMLHVKPGFTSYRAWSKAGSSIVMVTGIPGTVCRYVEILLQFGVEDVPAVGVEFYAETLVFGAETGKGKRRG